jgi:hypothetical protein
MRLVKVVDLKYLNISLTSLNVGMILYSWDFNDSNPTFAPDNNFVVSNNGNVLNLTIGLTIEEYNVL